MKGIKIFFIFIKINEGLLFIKMNQLKYKRNSLAKIRCHFALIFESKVSNSDALEK